MEHSLVGFGTVLGYDTPFLGPMRLGFAVNNNARFFSYLSIGFDYDAFFLSRR